MERTEFKILRKITIGGVMFAQQPISLKNFKFKTIASLGEMMFTERGEISSNVLKFID